MKLHLDRTETVYRITGYGEGYVSVNGREIRGSLIVAPDSLVTDWAPSSVECLVPESMAPALAGEPQILLLGTGARHRFPDPALMAAMASRGVGLEVMTTAAACRTYNVLVGEGRAVAAALVVD